MSPGSGKIRHDARQRERDGWSQARSLGAAIIGCRLGAEAKMFSLCAGLPLVAFAAELSLVLTCTDMAYSIAILILRQSPIKQHFFESSC